MSFDSLPSKRFLFSYAERLERVQKNGRRGRGISPLPLIALVPTFWKNSCGNACDAGWSFARHSLWEGHIASFLLSTQLDQHSASYICRSYKFFKLEVISISVFRRYFIFLYDDKKKGIDNSNNNNNDNISYLSTVKLTCRKNLFFFSHRSYLVEEI